MDSNVIDNAINSYLEKLTQHANIDFEKTFPTKEKHSFRADYNKRWIKIVNKRFGQTMVFCFVDPSNGDIYKPASWNAPAKGVRGNLFNERLPLDSGSLYR